MTSTPVLVTGIHRSGTTWVGKMLAAGGALAYVSEPLNVFHRPGVLRAPVHYWYTYVSSENEADYLPAFQETLRLDYHTGAELKSLRSPKDVARMARDWSIFARGRSRRQRVLLKDPFAVFSALWFAERLNCQVVILVRHPAAFVSSLKRLDWDFDFRDLLAQPALMRDWLAPFRAELESAVAKPLDLIGQAGLLWRVVYHVVAQYKEKHPAFHIIRHEGFSLDPLTEFESLYAALDLPFTGRARRRISRSTAAANPAEVSARSIYSVKLDSRANLKNWQKRLTQDEIARIRSLTGDIAAHFYSSEDWQPG